MQSYPLSCHSLREQVPEPLFRGIFSDQAQPGGVGSLFMGGQAVQPTAVKAHFLTLSLP